MFVSPVIRGLMARMAVRRSPSAASVLRGGARQRRGFATEPPASAPKPPTSTTPSSSSTTANASGKGNSGSNSSNANTRNSSGSNSSKGMSKTPLIVIGSIGVGCGGAVALLGGPRDLRVAQSPEEQQEIDKGNVVLYQHKNYEGENVVSQYLFRTRDRLREFYDQYISPPSKEQLLPPLLPGAYRPSDYTLILDLDHTLVATEWDSRHGWRTKKRPGVDEFLDYCFNLFGEVVIFSDKHVVDVGGVIDKLDPNQMVLYRLYKGHMQNVDGTYYKDLTKLGRDIRKVIIIDDNPDNFSLQPNNGIKIKSFHGEDGDTALLELIPFLQAIVNTQVPDVRDVIAKYKSVDDVGRAFLARRNAQQQALMQQQQLHHMGSSTAPPSRMPPLPGAGAVPAEPAAQDTQSKSWITKLIWGS